MSDLRDLRAKITPEADDMLSAVSHATGRDKSDLAREVLHTWASEKLREVQMIERFFHNAKGSAREE